jgi:hypothetical protein
VKKASSHATQRSFSKLQPKSQRMGGWYRYFLFQNCSGATEERACCKEALEFSPRILEDDDSEEQATQEHSSQSQALRSQSPIRGLNFESSMNARGFLGSVCCFRAERQYMFVKSPRERSPHKCRLPTSTAALAFVPFEFLLARARFRVWTWRPKKAELQRLSTHPLNASIHNRPKRLPCLAWPVPGRVREKHTQVWCISEENPLVQGWGGIRFWFFGNP